MRVGINIIAMVILGLFISSVQAETKSQPKDMTQDVQEAKTPADHEALAKHYDEVAQEMQLKSVKYEEMLEKYETNAHLYGRLGEPLQEHSKRLINLYQDAAKTNLEMAEFHRNMAAEIK